MRDVASKAGDVFKGKASAEAQIMSYAKSLIWSVCCDFLYQVPIYLSTATANGHRDFS